MGSRRSVAGLPGRLRLGRDIDGSTAAYSGGGILTLATGEAGPTGGRFRHRDAWPRTSDYVSSIKLLALPAVAVSMAVISMRNTTYSLQTSVYVVYLDQIALVGTTIGMLFAAVGDRERGRRAVCRPRHDAWAIRAPHDAERHRAVDPADCGDACCWAASSRHAIVVSDRALAGWKGVIQPVHPVGARRAPSAPINKAPSWGLRQTGQRLSSILDPSRHGRARRPLRATSESFLGSTAPSCCRCADCSR